MGRGSREKSKGVGPSKLVLAKEASSGTDKDQADVILRRARRLKSL